MDELLDYTDDETVMAAAFNIMRILKPLNWSDTYYDNYLSMAKRYNPFFDSYMLMWNIGAKRQPKRVLEIGCRTGISICQLLSSYRDLSVLEKVVLVDPFVDGHCSPGLVFKNLQYLNLPYDGRVQIHVRKSEEFVPTLDETFDYILVDGDHVKPAAFADLESVVPLCEPGGVIVFDDISTAPGECALIDVWDKWSDKHFEEFDFYHRMEGKGVAWAVKK